MSGPPFDAQESALDISACDAETIPTPGHIQPHGVLIASAPHSPRISHVSANLESALGVPASKVIGASLEDFLGAAGYAAMEAALAAADDAPSSVSRLTLSVPAAPDRSVLAHRYLGRTVLELEPAPFVDEHGVHSAKAQSVISSLSLAQTVAELCQVVAREVRAVTGYDRVMVYRFDEEDHGTVVAEERHPELEPYLHNRYAEADIPEQARRGFLLQRQQVIPDVDYLDTPLVSADGAAETLDMAHCGLRGVSPFHRQSMRNMGVRASMSVSLVHQGALWGLIVCHHRKPMALPADLRVLCDLIGQIVSVLLEKVSKAEGLAERLTRLSAVTALRVHLEAVDSVGEALSRRAPAVLALLGAAGALIEIGGVTTLIGVTPPRSVALRLASSLRSLHGEDVVALSDAGRPGGVAAGAAEVAAGVLFMPLHNNPDDAIVCFRPERVQALHWGGAANWAFDADVTDLAHRPRGAWSGERNGRSAPWSSADLEIADEFRRMILGVRLWHAEVRLAHLSAYDPLTTLANRRTLKSHLDRCRSDGAHGRAAMLFFDLDRFKTINDSQGHSAGDQVLIQVAARLRRLTPEGGVAGRLGGDEFVIFWPGAGRSEATSLAERLLFEMAEPFAVANRQHYATASIGVACADIAGLDRIMREADEAMYAAKRQGGARAVVFEPGLHDVALSAMRTEQDLFKAVQEDGLEVHYQPVLRAPDRAVLGFEALVRWRHAERGWISPSEFIPHAEETGLITRIGAWVLARAVEQIAIWRIRHGDLVASVNVSPRQLMEGSLSELLADLLAEHRLPGAAVCLEVTESVMMEDRAVEELHRLRALGVRVAVDDFGAGYSSLAYLQRLPVDIVKIDRVFLTALGASPKADRFFNAIVDLAHTLELFAVAEGCETDAEWEAIKGSGCNGVQGWLFAPALPSEAVDAYLENSRSTP